MSTTITREEAKARLSRIGKTATQVALELGVSAQIVRGVLKGELKGATGDAHKVAVALGIKDGVIVEDGATIADALKAIAA